MSDLMILGVLRMPVTPDSDYLTLEQYIDRGRQAADLIEQQQKRIAGLKEQQHKTERLLRSSIDDEANKAVSVVGAVQNYISEVEKERDELAATIERLRDAGAGMAKARGAKELRDRVKKWDEVIAATPRINLNAVKCGAYRAGFLSGCHYGAVNLRKTWESGADQYANQRYPDKD